MSSVGDIWVRRTLSDGAFVQVEVICPVTGRAIHTTGWGSGAERATAFALRALADALLDEFPRTYPVQAGEDAWECRLHESECFDPSCGLHRLTEVGSFTNDF